MTSAGLLHTVPALTDTFHARIGELAPDLTLTHVADPGLLARAIEIGVDDEARDRVLRHVRHLVACGADAVMVTCSSIGEAAEAAARAVDVPVLRVDRAMAEAAVRTAAAGAGRVAVLATLESTLGPTERMLRRLARDQSRVRVLSGTVEDAAAARKRGDHAEHDRLVREGVERAASDADVVVLAQASMAPAAADATSGVPVLESVSTGTERLVSTLGAGVGTPVSGNG